MTDIQTGPPPTATLKLSQEAIQMIREAWRVAGGVVYSAPKGQMCAMAEAKLLAFLADTIGTSACAGSAAGVPMQDMDRLGHVETALRQLVAAVCPGLATGDLLADAGTALAAMATAEPAAYFGIDDEPLPDGSLRFLQIAKAHQSDEDVFPLYRRAPTVAELDSHIAQHQATIEVKAPAAAKKAGTK